MPDLADRLVQLRRERQLSQLAVAEALGMDPAQLQRLECGRTQNPWVTTVLRLADYYKVSLDYVVGRSWLREPRGSTVALTGLPRWQPRIMIEREPAADDPTEDIPTTPL